MRKVLAVILVAVLLVLGGYAICSAAKADDKPDKKPATVTICHANGKKELVRIVTNENAINGHFDNNGSIKQGHEDDVLKQGDVPCTEYVEPPYVPNKCPAGSYAIGKEENGDEICHLEPTGCPYGDSIPLGDLCDKSGLNQGLLTPVTDNGVTVLLPKDPVTGEVFYGK